ncbi:bifunctional metallophosphatase/5'-nucleotidase [Alkalibacterium pelagium]|jgi:2',3'-cyclic-nucleotide 2'-phosphodiesterase/3'-nucleotidase|uniref:2',3'-cyclic-nucleotide 2'-phosphodiesterase / 3'-nucleotidase n=1 Tax=Alkalibacterium pelagium TaxID=426702 RepID=A0A1H7FGX3_9LACT|nr:bifunctional UDP-sugar hydrolase/5'-nucleotidase [Alkalibacterium pelagium]GEN49367.1 2',3'-cyclic-nucleotide 2'-phosphodiesterase [Alkalibacterium pelagium]SEK25024.1 2',3'-cyclic-nucleotide 2'-phosphodiesterase / 3'-nucleotidase [Alkalibacterium pelagium]
MKITLFETSDVHGYLFPTDYQSRQHEAAFGLFKIASLLKSEREKLNGPSITIENGDLIQGSPFTHYVVKEKKEATVVMQAANACGFDIGVIGNHEFNYGLDYLNSAVRSADYPILSANILKDNGEPAFGQAYKIIEKEGVKIAILGLTTPYIPNWEHPENYEGLSFVPAVESAKKYVPYLKEQADVVVVSYHGGFEKDLETGEETEIQTGENEGYALLHDVEGIDVLLSGHQHRVIAQKVGQTAVVMPGDKGRYLGKVTLEIEESDGQYTLTDAIPELLSTEQVDVDESTANAFRSVNEEVEAWLDQPIGKVEGDMTISDVEAARRREHPYVEFVHKVQMHYAECDISGTALFNNQAKGFGREVTMRDVVLNYIYPNTLAVLRVSGRDLKAALERSATYFELDETGDIIVNPSFMTPKPQMYNYDMYEGIEYTIDVAMPKGKRIVEFSYEGKNIMPEDSLEIVINQYRAVGGGDYDMFDASKIIREVTIPMNELMGDYFSQFSPIKAEVNRNFKVMASK